MAKILTKGSQTMWFAVENFPILRCRPAKGFGQFCSLFQLNIEICVQFQEVRYKKDFRDAI